jgi:hypothetical protein
MGGVGLGRAVKRGVLAFGRSQVRESTFPSVFLLPQIVTSDPSWSTVCCLTLIKKQRGFLYSAISPSKRGINPNIQRPSPCRESNLDRRRANPPLCLWPLFSQRLDPPSRGGKALYDSSNLFYILFSLKCSIQTFVKSFNNKGHFVSNISPPQHSLAPWAIVWLQLLSAILNWERGG